PGRAQTAFTEASEFAMAPTLKDRSSADSPRLGVAAYDSAKPIALEIPVTVNGARAMEGTDKREPFIENTTTVLVFANGAVIRLTSTVQPGQLLFLTNEKTHKEVVCQVVKSKSDRHSSGYVELQFTESISGFWGLRFPNERSGSAPAPGPTVSNSISDAPGSSIPINKNSAPPPSATLVAGQPFKTEIKSDTRPLSKADLLAPSESSTQPPRLESNLLHEQLAALLSSDSAPEASSAREHSATPQDEPPMNATEAAAQILNIAD